MTDMIERVARAICALKCAVYPEISGANPCEIGECLLVNNCYAEAKASIEAMRTPTEKMLEAATATHALCDPGPYSSSPEDDEIWQAMIDAALEGK